MYLLRLSDGFKKQYAKLLKRNSMLDAKIAKTFRILKEDPFYPSLRTHKVDTKQFKDVWSSRITGDWRLIWMFDVETGQEVILCLQLGTHSGGNQVYPNKT